MSDSDSAGLVHVSPSRISTLGQCQYRYWLSYVVRVPSVPTKDQLRGTIAHAFLEHFYGLEPEGRVVSWFDANHAEVRSQVMEAESRDGGPNEWARFAEAFPGETECVWDEAVDRAARIFLVETPAEVAVDRRETPMKVEGSQAVLRCIADRVDDDGETVTVVDYKSGKCPKKRFAGEKRKLMEVYAWALWHQGVAANKYRILFLSPDGTGVVEGHIDSGVLANARAVIDRFVDTVISNTDTGVWATSQGPLCNWCEYQQICPVFGGNGPTL